MKSVAAIVFWLVGAIGALSLTSCTTWKPTVLPSGQHGFVVDCSGTNLSWSHCYRKAGKACPRGYDIIQRMEAHDGKVVAGDLFGVLGGSVQDRSLMIRCDDPEHVPAARNGVVTYPVDGDR